MSYNYGKVKGINPNVDYYLIECSSGVYHIIESTDQLYMKDIILWNEEEYLFYNKTQGIEISALFQYQNLTFEKGVELLNKG